MVIFTLTIKYRLLFFQFAGVKNTEEVSSEKPQNTSHLSNSTTAQYIQMSRLLRVTLPDE